MAVQPGYDANRFPSAPIDLQRNKTVTDTYEPGSTFKIVTYAAALSSNLVSPDVEVPPAVLDPGRRPRDPRRREPRHGDDDGRADPLALVERRRDHARGDARPLARRELDQPVRLRQGHGRRRTGRDAGAAAELLVGLDDRDAPDRSRDRGHAGADGGRVRGGRERRRLAAAAPRRARRRRRVRDERVERRRVVSRASPRS